MPRKRKRKQYPFATLIPYGPNDRVVTKVVLGVFLREESMEKGPDVLKRWIGANILDRPKPIRELRAILRDHKVKAVISAPHVMGCPHEEGDDFPRGEDCPFCPFWKGRQGSGATEETPWSKIEQIAKYELQWPESFSEDSLLGT